MTAENPRSSLALVGRLGLRGVPALARTRPDATLWDALGGYFRDPRLRQLFGRYATYVGASPLAAPATLMLVAYVEQAGVWRVTGGMHATARALASLATRSGAHITYERALARIETEGGRVSGVTLADGDRLPADAVVFNGDAAALASGLAGEAVKHAVAGTPREARSLSAVTFCVAARASGFSLSHHNVFFADDYPQEFTSIFEQRAIVDTPTVYLCAQARGTRAGASAPDVEPMLLLVNAPADGDVAPLDAAACDGIRGRAERLLAACHLDLEIQDAVTTGPAEFHARFPGTGGALYGRANHGPFESFRRPGPGTKVPGLYLAGGSAHPGAGVPMATLSGRLAAARLLADRDGGSRRGHICVPIAHRGS